MIRRARGLVVAIDGPAGAGKSTVSERLAQSLGYTRVDTGALYRGLALVARESGIAWDDGARLAEIGARTRFEFVRTGRGQHLIVEGVDREADIRMPDISRAASVVSAHPEVRAALLDLQRRLGSEGGVVLEGRDIGTVVFPDADLKIFLTASDEARARRRQEELARRGVESELSEVRREIEDRDRRDSTRAVAPLAAAPDAVRVDTTSMSMDEVVAELVEHARSRMR